MSNFLAICVLTLCMATASFGLNCYTCSSLESAEDCEQQQKLHTCVPEYDQCLTLFITYKTGNGIGTANSKSCADQAICNRSEGACSTTNGNCSFNCCKSDSCNSGDGPTPQPNKCYMCSSEKSWDDCENNKTEIICPYSQQDSCAEAFLEGKRGGQPVKIYVKGCVHTELCHPDYCKLYDPTLTNTTCDLHCCTGDLCNNKYNNYSHS
ncbi:hypothetical protein ACROYT_G008309 [Oculina patagonica]